MSSSPIFVCITPLGDGTVTRCRLLSVIRPTGRTTQWRNWRREQAHVPPLMMKWCLMSSDVSWHIRDKLWPMPKHGSIILYVHWNQRTAQDVHLDSHTAPELCAAVSLYVIRRKAGGMIRHWFCAYSRTDKDNLHRSTTLFLLLFHFFLLFFSQFNKPHLWSVI